MIKICKGLQAYIQQYLLEFKTVSIDGWGSLQLIPSAAAIDFPNKKMKAPAVQIVFSNTAQNGTGFKQWLADKLNISEHEATAAVEAYVHSFKEKIKTHPVVWSGWGSFAAVNHTVVFTHSVSIHLSDIVADRVIRKGAEHSIRVGEDERTNTQMEEFLQGTSAKKKYVWWMGSLFLMLIGIILAVLFAYKHDIQWKKYTNYHQLQPQEPPVLYKTP